jgi:predicted ABC-class ATPase
MVDAQLVARLRQDAFQQDACRMEAAGFGSPLTAIEALAYDIGSKSPAVLAEASQILALAAVAKSAGPSRDEIAEAIEDLCGEELSGCCVNRIADAVMKLYRMR